jgi:hypothetical protein
VGAWAVASEVRVFLDGDTLADPDLIRRRAAPGEIDRLLATVRRNLEDFKPLAVFGASPSSKCPPPADARIGSLIELAAVARGDSGVDFDAARARLGWPGLGSSLAMTAAGAR